MITPPNGSAETSGMKERVSREPRQRKAFTPSAPPPSAPSRFVLEPNRVMPFSVPRREPRWLDREGSLYSLFST
jgi:hypothetical protein